MTAHNGLSFLHKKSLREKLLKNPQGYELRSESEVKGRLRGKRSKKAPTAVAV